jgi:hypothetical protein
VALAGLGAEGGTRIAAIQSCGLRPDVRNEPKQASLTPRGTDQATPRRAASNWRRARMALSARMCLCAQCVRASSHLERGQQVGVAVRVAPHDDRRFDLVRQQRDERITRGGPQRGGPRRQPGRRRSSRSDRRGKGRNPCPGCARLAPRTETLDRAHPGHPTARAPRGNLAAANLKLTTDDLAQIETAAGQIKIQGARYPEQLERLIDR